MNSLFRLINQRAPRICPDVRAWIDRGGGIGRTVLLREGERFQRNPPLTIETGIASEFERQYMFDVSDLFSGVIPGARICGEQGLVILPDGQFAYDYLTRDLQRIRESPFYFKRWQRNVRTRVMKGAYFPLTGLWCTAWYHWVHDVLQRLWKLDEWLPSQVRLIIPARTPPKGIDFLNAAGADPSRLVRQPPDEIWAVDFLHFAPPPVPTGWDAPFCATWLRETLTKSLHVNRPRVRSGHYYISRAHANSRRVLNEEKLLLDLQGLGFESIRCETLSVEATADLFANAAVVIAPHGAGLVNLFFSEPGTKVLEFFPPKAQLVPCYWSLCEALGHQYCDGFGVRNETGQNGHDDFELPFQKCIEGLNRLGVR